MANVEVLEPRTLLSESASAQLTLASTTGTVSNPVYHYQITVTDTGTTNIGTFWFAWVPGEDFLPSVPSATTNPTGWTNTLTGNGNSVDGTAIEWVASSNPITPGHSLSGFGFTTTDSPTALAGTSPSHPGTPVLTSFIYVGAPLTDPGFQFQVSPAATTAGSTTTLTSSAPSTQAGAPVTFTATVAPSSGSGPTPTGTVNFTQDGNAIGSGTLQANGTATLTSSTLPVGTDHITASYAGDSNYSASSSTPLTETVSPASTGAATTTALTSSQASAPLGSAISLTATVAPSSAGPAPTGTVNFTVNGSPLGTAAVQTDGTAALATSALPAGSDVIVATYSGDAVYASSVSQPLTESITHPATLAPSITTSTLPPSVVAGTAVHGAVRLSIANQTGAAVKGRSTIAVYATTDGEIDSSSVLLGQVVKSLSAKAGKSLVASVPIHLTAGALPAGSYTLVARVTDPAGQTNDSAAGATLNAAPAFIALSEVLSKSSIPTSAASGAKIHGSVSLAVTNSGNISTPAPTTVELFATTAGVVDASAVRLAGITSRARIRPGKSARLTVPVSLLPTLAPGTYTIVAQVTDASGQVSSVAVGPLTVTA